MTRGAEGLRAAIGTLPRDTNLQRCGCAVALPKVDDPVSGASAIRPGPAPRHYDRAVSGRRVNTIRTSGCGLGLAMPSW